MNLYLARHASAVKIGGAVSRDVDRPLTVSGEEEAELVGKILAGVEPSISTVVTSPLVRAVQTGKIIAGQMSNHLVFKTSANLSPGFRHKALQEELLAIGGHVLAIGHEPDMSKFVSYLIADSSAASVRMETSAVANVELTSSASNYDAELRWLLTPALIRRIHP